MAVTHFVDNNPGALGKFITAHAAEYVGDLFDDLRLLFSREYVLDGLHFDEWHRSLILIRL